MKTHYFIFYFVPYLYLEDVLRCMFFFVCIQKNIKIQGMSSDVLRLFLGLKPKFVLLMFSQNDDIRVKKSH